MGENFENTFLVGVIFLVIALVFLWAAFIRKPSRRGVKYQRPRRATPNSHDTSIRRRKRRRRDKTKNPANPTLAETRGLPPIREDYRANADYYQQ